MSPADMQFSEKPSAKCPVTGWAIHRRPDWTHTEEDFSIRYEVLNGKMVHAIAAGYLHEDYIQPIFNLRRRILTEAGLDEGFDGFISDFSAVSGSSHRARLKYIKLLKADYQQSPFNSYTSYGASRWLRAAIKVSSMFTPFKVYVAADYQEAVTLAAGQASGTHSAADSPESPPDNYYAADTQPLTETHIEEL